jgi:hypothetical protein
MRPRYGTEAATTRALEAAIEDAVTGSIDILDWFHAMEKKLSDVPSQPPTRAVKIDEILVTRARIICADRGENLAEYFSAILRPKIDRDYRKLIRELDGMAS